MYEPTLIHHSDNGYDNSLNKFTFQVGRVKVKVAFAVFRKNIIIGLAGFFVCLFFLPTSHKCYV